MKKYFLSITAELSLCIFLGLTNLEEPKALLGLFLARVDTARGFLRVLSLVRVSPQARTSQLLPVAR